MLIVRRIIGGAADDWRGLVLSAEAFRVDWDGRSYSGLGVWALDLDIGQTISPGGRERDQTGVKGWVYRVPRDIRSSS